MNEQIEQWAELLSEALTDERDSDRGRSRVSELAMLPPAGPIQGDSEWQAFVREALSWMSPLRKSLSDAFLRPGVS